MTAVHETIGIDSVDYIFPDLGRKLRKRVYVWEIESTDVILNLKEVRDTGTRQRRLTVRRWEESNPFLQFPSDHSTILLTTHSGKEGQEHPVLWSASLIHILDE